MHKILIITDDNNNFHCHYQKKSLDLNIIINALKSKQNDVEVMTYSNVINHIMDIKNKIIIYTSIEFAIEYKESIKDIMYILQKNNTLIPNYDILMAHENKLFQEIYKKYINYSSIPVETFINFLSFNNKQDINYPQVLKLKDGSGSTSVFKVKNKYEVFKIIRKQCLKNVNYNLLKSKSARYKLKVKIMNNIIRFSPLKISFYLFNKNYKTIYTNDCNFILQELIPNQKCDYKVLIYWDKIFSIRRKVRPKDFRASGSGKFSSAEMPEYAINQLLEFYQKIGTPILSLDILLINKEIKIIEWQGIHFGPATVDIADKYYDCQLGKYIENKYSIEEIFAYAYINYIEKNYGK